MITLLSSGTYRFSPFIKKADICIVGGGGQGLYSAYEMNEGGYGAAGGWVSQYPITANDIITVSIGGANSSGIDSTDTSIKINNENLVLSMKYEKKISQKNKAGENGFLIFGDSSLGWVGSSGGSGGYSKGYGYDAGLSGRIGAGAGGGAEWPSTADNGGNATGYVISNYKTVTKGSESSYKAVSSEYESFFPGPPPLVAAVKGAAPEKALTEVILLIPLSILHLVGYRGLQKGLQILSTLLRRA